MEEFLYHVTLPNASNPSDEKKKLVKTTKGNAKNAIAEKFNLNVNDTNDWRLQMYEELNNDWLDVDMTDELPSGTGIARKLKIIITSKSKKA